MKIVATTSLPAVNRRPLKRRTLVPIVLYYTVTASQKGFELSFWVLGRLTCFCNLEVVPFQKSIFFTVLYRFYHIKCNQKRLKLSQRITSCTKLKGNDNCTMTVKNHETYIGEIICTSGSNVKDIKNQKISEKYHKSKCLKI